LEADRFFAELNRRLTNSSCRDVVVFVHATTSRRDRGTLYCQLSWIGFPRHSILYSWPSHGTLLSYPRDEESALLTEAHLRLFLQGLLANTAATNVHLIGTAWAAAP